MLGTLNIGFYMQRVAPRAVIDPPGSLDNLERIRAVTSPVGITGFNYATLVFNAVIEVTDRITVDAVSIPRKPLSCEIGFVECFGLNTQAILPIVDYDIPVKPGGASANAIDSGVE